MKSENPWSHFDDSVITSIRTRRVDPQSRWNFFWGINQAGQYLLLLLLDTEPHSIRFPHIRGISVSGNLMTDGRYSVITTLEDPQLLDIFHKLCLDLVQHCEMTAEEPTLTHSLVHRLESWKKLLSRKNIVEMTEERRKGLLAELSFLQTVWMKRLSPH